MKTLNILLGILMLCLPLPGFSGTVVEYFNNDLHHFFYTAEPAEQSWLDSLGGSPDGGGWFRTGEGFVTGGKSPVCRFYGSGIPGPDSHFYTVDAQECNDLIAQQAATPDTEKRWNFEGYAFNVSKPVNGTCPAYTIPVYRAYNRGDVGGYDSNHRLATDIFDILAVVNCGWLYEGVVMCVPQ